MDGSDFLSGILLNGADGHVAGLEDMAIPITQETQEDEVEEVQATRSTNRGSRRAKNFDWEEDKVVVAGWLHVSKDPINGANQSRSTFWGRVHEYWEEKKTTNIPRTESSIMHRWLTIQHQVNKFCSCYDAIDRRNQSGQTIQDKIAEASKMYTELDKDKKKFNLILAWNILKGEDKWIAKMVEIAELEKLQAATNNKKKKSGKVSRRREEEHTNNAEANTDAADQEPEPRKRSEGIKKAKENLRRGGNEACLEAIDKMWAKKEAADIEKEKAKQERFMAALEIDKETLEIEKKRAESEDKRAEADLIKQEKEIIFADTTSLNPLQREWLEMMQQKIMARRRAN